jgi:DNA polymerase I-like protein with 3'-5' exonuclease and polymerase domains
MSLLDDLASLGTCFALDTETALAPKCFEPDQWRLLQLHNDSASLWYDIPTLSQEDRELLRSFLERRDLEIYGQNLLFDYRVLHVNGIQLKAELFDTLVASSLIHNGGPKISHALAEIARRELSITLDKKLQDQDWMNAELNDADLAYAMEDVRVTWEAAHVLHEKIAAQGLEDVYRLECALIPAVSMMEHHGMWVDPDALSETIDHYTSEVAASKDCYLETLDGRLQGVGKELPKNEDGTFNTRPIARGRGAAKLPAGYNVSSPQQTLAYWKEVGLEPVDEKGKSTTDKKILASFQSDELVRMFLYFRRAEKRLGMAKKLVEHRDEDGRIRARFMPLATGTGRFATSGPNIQQIPRDPEFRCAFRAPEGRVLVQADYAAMELRVAAAIANEQAMLDAFNDGADIHTRTAALMFGIEEYNVSKEQRQQAKAVNFGALYGSSARGVQSYFSTLGMFVTEKKARELLKLWHAAYPAFGVWHEACQERAMKNSPVTTVIGRRRKLFGEENRLTTQANNQVQGTSADIMKAALVEIHSKLPTGAFLVATVHDEVIVECREEQGEEVLAIVLREMEDAAKPMLGDCIRIQAEGGVLQSWGDK